MAKDPLDRIKALETLFGSALECEDPDGFILPRLSHLEKVAVGQMSEGLPLPQRWLALERGLQGYCKACFRPLPGCGAAPALADPGAAALGRSTAWLSLAKLNGFMSAYASWTPPGARL